MEKPNFVRKGELRLPIGFRFHPTDEELVVHYLRRKAFNFPLPASVIPEFDVFQSDPWDLPGDWKEQRYFFSNRIWHGNKCNRATGSGYWRAVGKDKPIVASGSNLAVGLKRSLVFHEGKRCNGTRTRWVMHEYRLVGSGTNHNSTQNSAKEMEDWVVYRIFQKKNRSKSHGVISQPSNGNKIGNTESMRPSSIDFVVEDSFESGPPQPSSSCSSGITEVSSSGTEQEESSAYINFASYSCKREH